MSEWIVVWDKRDLNYNFLLHTFIFIHIYLIFLSLFMLVTSYLEDKIKC